MKIFREAWSDIRRGENIDLYLAVVAAFVLAILNLIGLAPQAVVTTVMLGALGVLTISALKQAHNNKELIESLRLSNKTYFLYEFPDTYQDDLVSSTECWIMGASLSNFVNTRYSLLVRKLRAGHIIKILVVDPSSSAAEMSDMRSFGRVNVERQRADIRNSLQNLCEIKEDVGGDKLEIRTINYPISYGVFAFNPDQAAGVLYIKHYPFKTEIGSIPKFVLRPSDGEWFDLYKQELMNLWNSATVWDC